MHQPVTTRETVNRIVALEPAYCRFNNARSLRAEDGRLEIQSFGNVLALRDETRSEQGYYNRAVGLGPEDLEHADSIISWYHSRRLRPRFDLTPAGETPEV